MEIFRHNLLIPENRQITLTLPDTIPTGEAEVALVINPKHSTMKAPKEDNLLELVGILKNSPNFTGDPVQIQRKIRQEWDG